MARTYYYEGAPIVAPFNVTSSRITYTSETLSLSTKRLTLPAQRWELSFKTVVRDGQADLLLGLIGDPSESQTMVMPQLEEVNRRLTFDESNGYGPRLGANLSTGDTSIQLYHATKSGRLPKGYFFKFHSHSKVYVLTEDVDIVAGEAPVTANFFPESRGSQQQDAALRGGDNIVFTYFKDDSTASGVTFTDGLLVDPGTIKLIEKV